MAEAGLPDGGFGTTLLSRIEDAGINASAPPQQLWQDGWLLRLSPGKAKRARCINAVATGRVPLPEKLHRARATVRAVGLPLIVRITPFTQPANLDDQLAERGFTRLDDTRVMVCTSLPTPDSAADLPAGLSWQTLNSAAFAEAVGALRDSPTDQRLAHAERLRCSPVPYRGAVIRHLADNTILACGQVAQEDDIAGLYDVFTCSSARGRGLATLLCRRLLAMAAASGATVACLQVESDNHAARRIYQRLGFTDAYGYHYRQAPDAG